VTGYQGEAKIDGLVPDCQIKQMVLRDISRNQVCSGQQAANPSVDEGFQQQHVSNMVVTEWYYLE
jgi:hypothetical protein